MADMMELSAQYRMTGAACREKLRGAQRALAQDPDFAREMELRRDQQEQQLQFLQILRREKEKFSCFNF